MKKIIVIYDDSRKPNQEIKNITGKKSFGNTIFKRISLKKRMEALLLKEPVVLRFLEEEALKGQKELTGSDVKQVVFRLFSDFGIASKSSLGILLDKACYVNKNYRVVCDGRTAAVIYTDYGQYLAAQDEQTAESFEKIETDVFVDLSNVSHFRQFITSGFDARFFNALSGDNYTVVKRSNNAEKLCAEYEFYALLPDEMKMWFVMPFDFKEEDKIASYTMQRYHMTDLAIRYVHGAITEEEFGDILEKLFHFIRTRKQKQVLAEEYEQAAEALYIGKVERRLQRLKELPQFDSIEALLKAGTNYNGIDAVFEAYKQIYGEITAGRHFQTVLVVGHGDLCFSNILYGREASLLKLIDPKGATDEASLYMNPYYDLAKLSHSICGSYDYFNSGLFEIELDEHMRFRLTVDCDNEHYIRIFKEYLKNNGLDYRLIRLYEASLFLSMLPLHIDREKKVFAFLLNALNILEELGENECLKE
ncbi:MAG: hypothetical protein QM697_01395 [Lachnospiraceae bacterium]